MNILIFSIKIFQILENCPKFKTSKEGQAFQFTCTIVPEGAWGSVVVKALRY
jgi:hypothetical protein